MKHDSQTSSPSLARLAYAVGIGIAQRGKSAVLGCLHRIEARYTWRRSTIRSAAGPLRFVRSFWWDDTAQEDYDRNIRPYFGPIQTLHAGVIVDAGTAGGRFAITAARRFGRVRVFCFEPSNRQRALLRRNIRLNGLTHRVTIEPFGLWCNERIAPFRTHGAAGSVREASLLPPPHPPFTEKVRLTTLDAWCEHKGLDRIDLIKLNVSGSELESLQGARNVLARFRPCLLVRIRHVREDASTFERLTDMLKAFDYECMEIDPPGGLLYAVARTTLDAGTK